jgi:hypothetical protein
MSAPTRTQTPVGDVLDHVAVENILWARLLAVRQGGAELSVCMLELVSGAPPPEWEPTTWEYPEAIFLAFQESGSEMAEGLRRNELSVDGRSIQLPELQSPVQWERHQSGHHGSHQPLEWPVAEARLLSGGPQYEPQGHLLSVHDAPSFLTMYTAATNFFRMGKQVAGGAVNQAVVYRHQDRRARITHVRIGDDLVEVSVEGAAIDGMTVELPGDSPGPSQRIWEDPIKPVQLVQFELKNRLPPGAWLVVRKGPEWVDRRFLTDPWSREAQSGVEFVMEVATRLESLVASRERDQLEFKRQVPKEADGKGRLMKTICAFANGAGGSLLIGVDDDRNIVGVAANDVGRISDQLTELAGAWVEPRPAIEFLELPTEDGSKVVLEMRVGQMTGDICASGRPGETKLIYVRHHGVTERATAAEIKALIAAKPGTNALSFSAFG